VAHNISVDEIIRLAETLSLPEKVRLMERLVPAIAREAETEHRTPKVSLRGLWKGIDISTDDIAEARREMWSSFPRRDI
jgi:hypothetical protein